MSDYSRFSQTWDCGFELFDKGIHFSVCLIYGPLYTVSILLSQPVKAASTTTILASEEKVFAVLSFIKQQATHKLQSILSNLVICLLLSGWWHVLLHSPMSCLSRILVKSFSSIGRWECLLIPQKTRKFCSDCDYNCLPVITANLDIVSLDSFLEAQRSKELSCLICQLKKLLIKVSIFLSINGKNF